MSSWLQKHFSSEQTQHDSVSTGTHKGKLSHELIAAAASYEAAKAYEAHCEKQGKKPDHAEAKKIIAAVAGGFIDKLFETKGRDAIDNYEEKQAVKDKAQQKTEAKLQSAGEM
ncbi:hypothetical protein DFH07DRAFT_570220 [Mycena maculata]|uniref:CipC protein n=1 Tax=Mycena maculata TaxID=230809 RepID=A0AAD7NWH2_9AGAR|nr:hypothetical protein DFH07DRAFT_570220 [Mycena maculata]